MKWGNVIIWDHQGNYIRWKEKRQFLQSIYAESKLYSVKTQIHTCHLHCEPPLSRTVLNRDLKDAYRSSKLSSSKVKRSKGSVGGFTETTGGATADDGTVSSDE